MIAATRRIRALLTLSLLAFLVLLLAGPALYLLLAWDKVRRVEGKAHRRRVAAWQRASNRAVLGIIRACMGITVRLDLRGPLPPGPYLIISNHLGGFDGFLVLHLLSAIGRESDLRAIGKKQVMSWPIIGRAWRELRWGFVARDGHRRDYSAVEECGCLAFLDGADMLIFPEGTHFDAAVRKPPPHVLPPKPGGFSVLLRQMPERPVLDITITWERPYHGLSLFDGIIPYGRLAVVRVEHHATVPQPDDARPWLNEVWRRKDAWIASSP